MAEGKIYSSLKRRLISLDIPPNTLLNIGELCERMSVSHIPMREALACLALEGWVHHIPNRGYFARQIDVQTIVDCYECLEVVLCRGVELGHLDPNAGPSLEDDEPEGLFNHLHHAVQSVQNQFLQKQGRDCLGQVRFIADALWQDPRSREDISNHIIKCNRLIALDKKSEARSEIKAAFGVRIDNVAQEIKYAANLHMQKDNMNISRI